MRRLLFWGGLLGLLMWWQRQRERANATLINNKVVIITGASSGIGKATATAFAQAGAHVVLVARRGELLDDLKAGIVSSGVQVVTVAADLTDDAAMQDVVDSTLTRFGRIDVLVNNAGLGVGGALEKQDPAQIQKMIDINLQVPIRLCQLIAPIMARQRSGHMVNISSTAAIMRVPGQETYSATKAGLNAFSHGLRRELIGTGVRVSVVMPGWTDTPMIEQVDRKKMMGIRWGMIRLQSPEFVAAEIVDAVRYNRSRILLGGVGFKIADLLERTHPMLSDWPYKLGIMSKEEIIELMDNVG